MKKRSLLYLVRSRQGASLIELAMVMPVFMLMLFGAIDLGRAYYTALEIAGAAHAAAVWGSQHPSDTSGMTTAAQDDAPNVTGLSVTSATYGCENADGSGYTASATTCSAPMVYRANVTVKGVYKPILPWPGIASSITFTSSAAMRSAGG